LKKLFIEANKIEKLSIQYIVNINNSVGEVLKDIDVSGDIEDFTHDYVIILNGINIYIYFYIIMFFNTISK